MSEIDWNLRLHEKCVEVNEAQTALNEAQGRSIRLLGWIAAVQAANIAALAVWMLASGR